MGRSPLPTRRVDRREPPMFAATLGPDDLAMDARIDLLAESVGEVPTTKRAEDGSGEVPGTLRRRQAGGANVSPGGLQDGAFRLLAERSRDIVYRYRLAPDRGFEYVSQSVTAITGFTPEDHYADPDLGFKLVHPDDRQLLTGVATGPGAAPTVLRWIRRDGTVIWTEQHNTAIRDGSGAIVALEGTARDVTSREEALEAVRASSRRFLDMLGRVDLLAGTIDTAGRVTFANDALLTTTGRTADETIGSDWFDLFVPEHLRVILRAAYAADVATRTLDRDIETLLLTATGELRRVRLHVTAWYGRDGEVSGAAMMAEDLTLEDERMTAEAKLSAAIEQATDAVVITDAETRIVYVNPAFERVTGYRREELIGRNPRIVSSGRQSASFYRRMWRTLAAGSPWTGVLINRHKKGSLFTEEATITPVVDAAGVVTAYVGVKRDVTRFHELTDALDQQRRGREAVASSIATLEAGATLEVSAERVAAALLSIDGAALGGVLLFENAHIVRQLALVTDLGLPIMVGDELPPQRAAYIRERATHGPWIDRWRSHRDDTPYEQAILGSGVTGALYVPIGHGASPIGTVVVGTTDRDPLRRLGAEMPSALEVAAAALAILGPGIGARLAEREAVDRIDAVIAARAFRPVFQPIVDLRSGQPVAFEALTRFDDRTPTALVFAEARHAGRAVALEIATLTTALEAARSLPAECWLNVNTSPALVLAGDELGRILAGADRKIVVEITEHETVADYAPLREALSRLGSNVRVAVDDAGAGISNLGHLVELRPDFVKVDIGIIRGVDADVSRQAMVVGLRHFVRAIGGWIIAEGIETIEERAALAALDIQLGQGYLLGRPEPAESWPDKAGRPSRRAAKGVAG
ncbi:MAG: PAS domain S-box protein [Chloroflexota bacterium]|nr:MAG: PAS domain S-box protein [Chloroflexota bacterium]